VTINKQGSFEGKTKLHVSTRVCSNKNVTVFKIEFHLCGII